MAPDWIERLLGALGGRIKNTKKVWCDVFGRDLGTLQDYIGR